MKAEIIIRDGIIESCLVDQEAINLEIEIVEIDKNLCGNDKVVDYAESLYDNKTLFGSKSYTIFRAADQQEMEEL